MVQSNTGGRVGGPRQRGAPRAGRVTIRRISNRLGPGDLTDLRTPFDRTGGHEGIPADSSLTVTGPLRRASGSAIGNASHLAVTAVSDSRS